MSDNIKNHLNGFDYDHVLFSYHGIPERHIKKSDPTKNHCKLDGSCCERNSVAHHTCYTDTNVLKLQKELLKFRTKRRNL